MPRKGSKKIDYAVDKGRRKRAPRTVKHKRKDGRFKFREAMVRSLDELELGGWLPSYKELEFLFKSEEATVEYCCAKGMFDRPTNCPRCQNSTFNG